MTDQPPVPTDTEPQWQQLRELLGPADTTLTESIWTPDERAKALTRSIVSHLRGGWKWAEGKLKKGNIEGRPTELMPSASGDPRYNPRDDAFAVRLGAKFVSDNRYAIELGNHVEYMDRNGCFVPGPDEECPECGGLPWGVKRLVGLKDKRIPIYERTYCRRCVSPAEIEDAKRRRQVHEGKR